MSEAKRILLKGSYLLPGYRYVLRHLQHLPAAEQATSKHELRNYFNVLMSHMEPEITTGALQNIWSRVSYLRMNLSKLRRPAIPTELKSLCDDLGAAEGGGKFWIGSEGNLIDGEAEMIAKAKMYNTDLDPSDIRRHYALNERFHFNGSQRQHNN